MPPPIPPSMPRKRKLAPILTVGGAVLVSAMIVLVVASLNLGAFSSSALFKNTTSAQAPVAALNSIVGHVRFSSSGQINESTSQGIADQVELDLSNILDPAAGKSYYAWLLNDDPVEGKALLLDQLPVSNGQVHFHYAGDQLHTNLLDVTNRAASVGARVALLGVRDSRRPPHLHPHAGYLEGAAHLARWARKRQEEQAHGEHQEEVGGASGTE